MELLSTYLKSIEIISPQDKEHTHRTALENLLNAIKAKIPQAHQIHIKQEPNNDKEGRGAPDFLVTQDSLTLGYIENKRVNANLDEVIEGDQIAKYTRLSPNIILTDYLRFILLSVDEKGQVIILKEVRLCDLSSIGATLRDPSRLHSQEESLLHLFGSFFAKIPNPIHSALEFASHLSLRTRFLKLELLSYNQNPIITSLFNTFKEALYKELDFEDFCDSFAQTLTYSLFLARLSSQAPKIDLSNAKSHIPRSFPLIRAMSGFLDHLEDLQSIKWLLEEIIRIINHIEVASLIHELNKIDHKNQDYIYKDPYLHFYETFLANYDENLRKVRGVYYTPAPVVSFIINSIDEILKTTFKQKDGLSQALTNPNLTLLDFATGTGTFLLEAFRKALQSIPRNSPKYNPKALIPRFCAFEFLIAPYTIAHLKLSQSFKEEFHSPLNDSESLRIALTNTLYIADEKEEQNKINNLFFGMVDLTEEFKKAQKIKEESILIITGNPPYSGASSNKGLYEYEVRIPYGLEPSKSQFDSSTQCEIAKHLSTIKNPQNPDFKSAKVYLDKLIRSRRLENEKNPKWLLDDYVKFIRFAQKKIDAQDCGIFAFISNNGFLDNPTFRGMRHSLMQSFDTIYILDLHGNSRKKEKCPDGSKDDNVFDIMQGVSINIFIKSPPPRSLSKPSQIFHADLYGKRSLKYEFLSTHSLASIPWTNLTPKAPFYLFIPQNESLATEYDQGFSVQEMFRISSVGIVGGRDKFVISSSDSLKSLQYFQSNIQYFIELDCEEARKRFSLGPDSRDWQIKYAQEELKSTQNNPQNYIKIAYRPFDVRWTYYTGKSKGFHCMPRGEVMEHFLAGENIALSIPRQLKDTRTEWNHCLITNSITEQALTSGGNGPNTIFPLYLYPTERSKKSLTKQGSLFEETQNQIANFTLAFCEFVNSRYGAGIPPEEIFAYIYAVLFHKKYRERYIDFLKTDFPKIPFVHSLSTFKHLSELGSKLIDLHLLRPHLSLPDVGEALYEDNISQSLLIKKPNYLLEHQKLFINESLAFHKVSQEVWDYTIGGYQVLDKYLKSHKNEEIDFEHFTRVIGVLHATLEIEKEIAQVKLWEEA